jgi:D,D-heptose 1,7-bisphosphate phosphatase
VRTVANGTIARSSLAVKQRAVFLDRDGTLIVDKDSLRSAEGLELLPGVAQAIHDLNHHGWRTVVVTNQPVIAKGFCDEAELQCMHNKLETLLGIEHAFLDRIYFCPHHPEKGFPGERPELKIDCDCRKPKTGMIQRAVADLNIDLSESWLIGDTRPTPKPRATLACGAFLSAPERVERMANILPLRTSSVITCSTPSA